MAIEKCTLLAIEKCTLFWSCRGGSGAFLATLQGAHHQVSSCLECSAERVRATVSGRVRARVLRVPDADRAL